MQPSNKEYLQLILLLLNGLKMRNVMQQISKRVRKMKFSKFNLEPILKARVAFLNGLKKRSMQQISKQV
jgi:hypothetical protein